MELKQVGEGDEQPDMTTVGDPPDPPEDGGPDDVADLDDGELGDFDPSDDL
jgi:hypothetical protein